MNLFPALSFLLNFVELIVLPDVQHQVVMAQEI